MNRIAMIKMTIFFLNKFLTLIELNLYISCIFAQAI